MTKKVATKKITGNSLLLIAGMLAAQFAFWIALIAIR